MKCLICGAEIESKAWNARYCSEHKGKSVVRRRNGKLFFNKPEIEFEFTYGIKPTPKMLEGFNKWKKGNDIFK
jgi:hypothetical protein